MTGGDDKIKPVRLFGEELESVMFVKQVLTSSYLMWNTQEKSSRDYTEKERKKITITTTATTT